MSLLNVLRHRALCPPTPWRASPLSFARHVAPSLVQRPQWTSILNAPRLARPASNDTKVAKVGQRSPPTLKLREEINIFHAGNPAILSIGLFRITSIVIATVGTTLYPIMFYMSPDWSNWWILGSLIASPMPFLFMLFATGPFIHSISVKLPPSARMSKETLKAFADRPDPQALLRFRYMKVLPWPTSKEIPFGRLRRIKPSFKGGLANLEYIGETAAMQSKEVKRTIWFWLVQAYFGRFYVNRDQKKDRAGVPGVWEKMWHRIPEAGSQEDPLVPITPKKPVAFSGRPGRT